MIVSSGSTIPTKPPDSSTPELTRPRALTYTCVNTCIDEPGRRPSAGAAYSDKETSLTTRSTLSPQYDVIVVGAGICGIYQAYKLQQMGVRATVLERGAGPGGTWYWNRYPGCRFDSESETYGYSWSKELLAEWDWQEHYAPREETERYLQHVIEKFDLGKMMQYGCTVTAARWNEDERMWTVTLADGGTFTTRFLMTAIGLLSAPTPPRYPGVADFKGVSFHTYYAPHDPIDWRGKRVAVIGTGSTGVQII